MTILTAHRTIERLELAEDLTADWLSHFHFVDAGGVFVPSCDLAKWQDGSRKTLCGKTLEEVLIMEK